MTATASTYRWNQNEAAAAYDAAAPEIHPCYQQVQQAVLETLQARLVSPTSIVDLGGGSGRLAERVLDRFPAARVTIVDPSTPFLRLARQRLVRFGDRVRCVRARAQDPWLGEALADLLGERIDAIVSTSALHHLDATEKNSVFRLCNELLGPGGVFINGDEYRPPSDAAYRDLLEQWGEHMESALATGAIPESFRGIFAKWRRRNLDDFGGPRESGDDCHETIEEQTARLYGAGFVRVDTTWSDRLWSVLAAE